MERIVSIAIPGKNYADQHFAYYGDISAIFNHGIKNKFQKHLLGSNGFKVLDVITLFQVGKLFKAIKKLDVKNKIVRLLLELGSKIIYRLIYNQQGKLAEKLINKIKPSILIMDNAVERPKYFPHCLRQAALKRKIKIHITGHGPAGGLHKEYHTYEMIVPHPHNDCIVGICS